ncbi:MAG: hypothetical protein JXQ72_16510 [Anaerolineae bacterium]|nr:hypothetical protein [Anaerolineae bacterium]
MYLCRECNLAYPAPDVLDYRPDKKHGVVVRADSPSADRERMVSLENSLTRLQRGCVLNLKDDWTLERGLPCESVHHEPYLNCPVCRRELRTYTRRVKSGEPDGLAWLKRSHSRVLDRPVINRQLSLPVCERCGAVHGRRYDFGGGDFMRYCQQCEDEIHVETLWRMRSIFGNDDAESILDRQQKAFPGLFERGILPDMWFRLMLAEIRTD